MLNNKKGNFSDNWVQYLFLILIILGFIISFNIENSLIIYLVSYLAGIHCGIITYLKNGKLRSFPVWIVIVGFLIGYLIGSYDSNKLSIIVLFILGIVNGHMLLKKEIFPIRK